MTDSKAVGATTKVFEDIPDDSVFQREYDRYKLDTSTVTERSLGDEFRHVLSIIHRYDAVLSLRGGSVLTVP